MAFRCPRCGRDMSYENFSEKLGYNSGWICIKCDIFISNKEMKKMLCKP